MLAKIQYYASIFKSENISFKDIRMNDFIYECATSLDRALARNLIKALGGWDEFKRIAVNIHNDDCPKSSVHKYITDLQSLALMQENPEHLYDFALDVIFIDVTGGACYKPILDSSTSISLRELMTALDIGAEPLNAGEIATAKDAQIAKLITHTIIQYVSKESCKYRVPEPRKNHGFGMNENGSAFESLIKISSLGSWHIADAVGGWDAFHYGRNSIAHQINHNEGALSNVEQYITDEQSVRVFNNWREDLHSVATDLMMIDVVGRGKYKPIIDPVQIKADDLIKVTKNRSEYARDVSASTEIDIAKLLTHAAIQDLCAKFHLYNITQ